MNRGIYLTHVFYIYVRVYVFYLIYASRIVGFHYIYSPYITMCLFVCVLHILYKLWASTIYIYIYIYATYIISVYFILFFVHIVYQLCNDSTYMCNVYDI